MKTLIFFLFILNLPVSSIFSTDASSSEKQIFLKATRIIDGDTFEGFTGKETFRIRLNGIDAPEKGQDFYKVSKDRLGELCASGPLKVILYRQDRYRRWIADVWNSRNQSISQNLVSDGLAWHFKKYSSDTTLSRLETNARKSGAGLWSIANPTPPWTFRK